MQPSGLQTPYLSVVVPAYNEEGRIGSTLLGLSAYLEEVLKKPYEILVVLNNCTDNTLGVVRHEQVRNPNIHILDLGMIQGKGNTKGIAVAKGMLEAKGAYVVFTDADLATPVEEIGKLLAVAEQGTDAVIGSRRAAGANVQREQVWYRNMLGRLANILIQAMLLPGISDTQCGCKLFTREAAQDIFKDISTSGWGFDIEVLARARTLGYSIKEVGVRWHDVGDSKVSGGAYVSTLKDLGAIWWKTRIRS